MNRAERRRQEKSHKASRASIAVMPLLQEAVMLHRAGRYGEAEERYERILQVEPSHAEALHLLGLVAYRTGRLTRAADLLGQATRVNGAVPTYWFNYGVVLQKLGKAEQSAAAYERAIAGNARYPEALSNLGNVRREQGRLAEAVEAYRRAVAIRPDYAEAHNNLGVALKEQGVVDEARSAYARALELQPGHVEAQCNLGALFMEQGRLDHAQACFEAALRTKPDHVNALYHLGFVSLWQGRREAALDLFRRTAALKHGHGQPVLASTVSKSRIKHDAEQIAYLLGRKRIDQSWEGYLAGLTRLRHRGDGEDASQPRLTVTPDEIRDVAASYNQILFYGPAPEIAGGALNPALDVPAIEARYNATRPEVTYIDDLLKPEALASLRQFCLESTIWKRDYENGYLGAFLGDGFSCPLLLQIADELRCRCPGIFQQHQLTQAWAFKYDSARTGLNLHADAAAVNVNFWLTPDEANLDHTSGGLIVWDKEAPRDWNFKEYNSSRNEEAVRAFLQGSGAKAISVPHRANRAIVFNSDLFHETDRFQFKDEYESRRLNVTLLYGRRG